MVIHHSKRFSDKLGSAQCIVHASEDVIFIIGPECNLKWTVKESSLSNLDGTLLSHLSYKVFLVLHLCNRLFLSHVSLHYTCPGQYPLSNRHWPYVKVLIFEQTVEEIKHGIWKSSCDKITLQGKVCHLMVRWFKNICKQFNTYNSVFWSTTTLHFNLAAEVWFALSVSTFFCRWYPVIRNCYFINPGNKGEAVMNLFTSTGP